MDLTTFANDLAKGGSVGIILLLLIVITALLRRWVLIPDDNFIPREMYDAKVREADDWKETVKEYGDALRDAVNVLEAIERR